MIGSAAIMITDYSSAAFDMAYLEKEVIYYQFDKGDIFKNNAHTYQKGYFEYSREGKTANDNRTLVVISVNFERLKNETISLHNLNS